MTTEPIGRKRRKTNNAKIDYIEEVESPPRSSLPHKLYATRSNDIPSQPLSDLTIDTDHMLFSDRFAPSTVTDIAVHPAKLKQLTSYLENCMYECSHLLLTGPPGSGKSSSIRLLSATIGLTVDEWEYEDEYIEAATEEYDWLIKCLEREFEEFLRFIRLTACGFNGEKYIKLIRYLPSLAYRNPHLFREKLLETLKLSRQPIVFCLCDVNSFYDISPEKLFTPNYISEIAIQKIALNPVFKTNRVKVLRKAKTALGKMISDEAIQTIAELSEGDLRTAFNIMQFSQNIEGKVEVDKCLQKTLSNEMFHMLGRIMHARRLREIPANERPEWLPTELQRPPPENEINDILGMSVLDPNYLMLYAHEHEPNFSPSITNTAKVLEALSFADSLTNRWDAKLKLKDAAELSSSRAEEYVSQIAARAVYFYNFKKKGSGFLAFKLPRWHELSLQIRSLINDLHRTINVSRLGNRTAILQIGMLSSMRPTVHSSQFEIISYMCRPMSFSWQLGRQNYQNMLLQRKANRRTTGIPLIESRTDSVFSLDNIANSDSEDEKIIIENSDQSEDSFDEDPFN